MKFPAFDPIDLKNDINLGIVYLAIDKIYPDKNQSRKKFNKKNLEELSCSISKYGILQPIIVKKLNEDEYQIIAGQRRWRASCLAGLKEIPVIIKDEKDKDNMAIALIENIQRKELNSIELAEAFYDLNSNHGLTYEIIAEMVGKKRATVTNLICLLNLNSYVKDLLAHGKIEVGHAKVLLSLEGEQQIVVAKKIIEKKLSVRETEQLVKLIYQNVEYENSGNLDILFLKKIEEWEKTLSEELSTKVSVRVNRKGKGKIIINVVSSNEIENLVKKLAK